MSVKPVSIDSHNAEQVEFLRENIEGRSYPKLAAIFNERFDTNVSRHTVSNFCRRYKLADVKHQRQRYTAEQIKFLRENVKGRFYEELTAMFNERFNKSATLMAIIQACRQYKMPNRMNGGFQKGHTRNSGKALPDGVENTNILGYRIIKHNGMWRGKHTVLWEEAHGQRVPEGHYIVFGDGNKENLSIDNLYCVSATQSGILTQFKLKSEEPELAAAGVALAGLYATINKRQKKKGKESSQKRFL